MSLETILNVSCSDDENAETLKRNNKPVKEISDEKPRIIIEADEIKLEEKFNFQPFVKRKKLMDRLYDLKKMYYVNDSDATGEQS